MTTNTNKKSILAACTRAQADIASLADWIECELEKYDDDAVTWADLNTLESTRECLMEALASFSGVTLPEIQSNLDELHM
jgi:hypothetical protein